MTVVTECDKSTTGLGRAFISKTGEWLFALFLLAVTFKNYPRLAFIQTHIDLTFLFLCLSFMVFIYRGFKGSFTQKIPLSLVKLILLFLLLASCLIGGLLYTQSRQYGFDKAMRFIFLTGWAFFGAVLLICDYWSLRRFSWAIVTISTTIDALLYYHYLGAEWIGYVTFLGCDRITLARASGLGLLTTVVFLLPTERRPLVKLCLWLVATLQLLAILSAGARGPVLALILSFLLFFALSVRGFLRLRIDRFALRLGVLALFAAIILAVVGREPLPTLWFRSQLLITEGDISGVERFVLYQAALDQWVRSPIWGGGTGQFGVALRGEEYLYPHNIVLELGAETGLLGVLVFVIMIGIAFRKGLVCLHTGSGRIKTVSRYLLVACCFALLNAMVSYDINDNRILFTWLGLLAAISRFCNCEVERGWA